MFFKLNAIYLNIVKINGIYFNIIKNLSLELTVLAVALIIDFFIRNKLKEKLNSKAHFDHNLVQDFQKFCFNFGLKSLIILFSSLFYSIFKEPFILMEISSSILIIGFFNFLSKVAENKNIKRFGFLITGIGFFKSLDENDVFAKTLSKIRFNLIFTEINLILIFNILFKVSIFYCIRIITRKIFDIFLPKVIEREDSRKLTKSMISYFIYTAFVLNILTGIGLKSSDLAMIGSAIGIGLGFGLQKFASNFISGIIIISEGKFKIGDLIILENSTAGSIVEISSRATIMETFSQERVLIPNEVMLNSIIKNLTLENTHYNIRVDIKIKHTSDFDKAIEIMTLIVKEFFDKKLISVNDIIRIDEILDSGILLYTRLYFENIKAGGIFNPWTVKSNFILEVTKKLQEHNIHFATLNIQKI